MYTPCNKNLQTRASINTVKLRRHWRLATCRLFRKHVTCRKWYTCVSRDHVTWISDVVVYVHKANKKNSLQLQVFPTIDLWFLTPAWTAFSDCTLKLSCVLQVLGKVKQPANFQHRISMHHTVMRIRIFHGLTIICAQNGAWGFWGWTCENIVFWPPKGTTLREYASVAVSHDKIGSTALALGPWKDFCVRRNKKVSGNFGYMERSNPLRDIDQMWHVGRYGGRNHVCNIWWLSVKGCGCGDRGNFPLTWGVALTILQWKAVLAKKSCNMFV